MRSRLRHAVGIDVVELQPQGGERVLLRQAGNSEPRRARPVERGGLGPGEAGLRGVGHRIGPVLEFIEVLVHVLVALDAFDDVAVGE